MFGLIPVEIGGDVPVRDLLRANELPFFVPNDAGVGEVLGGLDEAAGRLHRVIAGEVVLAIAIERLVHLEVLLGTAYRSLLRRRSAVEQALVGRSVGVELTVTPERVRRPHVPAVGACVHHLRSERPTQLDYIRLF